MSNNKLLMSENQEINKVIDETIKLQMETMIDDFYKFNNELNEYKKSAEVKKSIVKNLMSDNDLNVYVTENGIRAKLTVTDNSSINEDELLKYLKAKDINIPGLIKTKEYIDMDILEDALYHNLIDAKELVPFKTDKTITKLTVSKPKILTE